MTLVSEDADDCDDSDDPSDHESKAVRIVTTSQELRILSSVTLIVRYTDSHEFRFLIVGNVISVSNGTHLSFGLFKFPFRQIFVVQ